MDKIEQLCRERFCLYEKLSLTKAKTPLNSFEISYLESEIEIISKRITKLKNALHSALEVKEN